MADPQAPTAAAPRRPLTRRCSSCGFRYEADLEICPVDSSRLPRERPELEHIGPYVLVSRIGTGGMGAVYRALNQKVGRTVALKMLHRSLQNDAVGITRFFHEARAVNTIRHPNVVEVYDLASIADDHVMVMEFLHGQDLHAALQRSEGRRLEAKRAVIILEQMCGALYAAHLRDIVHRDLKPANIFLQRKQGDDDFVKLLDFGVAKLNAGQAKLTADGVTLGTPEYMAPEQARGDEVDSRSDIYAVGCIAYQMLCGRLPIVGTSVADTMVRQLSDTPPPLRKWVPDLPEALEAAVLSCLEKDPDDRPRTAMDLAQRLSAAVGVPFDTKGAFSSWQKWDGAETTSTIRGLLAARTLSMPPARARTGWQWKSKKTALSAAGLVSAIGFVAGGVALFKSKPAPDPPAFVAAPVAAAAPPAPETVSPLPPSPKQVVPARRKAVKRSARMRKPPR